VEGAAGCSIFIFVGKRIYEVKFKPLASSH
jgi:hypothetical protein